MKQYYAYKKVNTPDDVLERRPQAAEYGDIILVGEPSARAGSFDDISEKYIQEDGGIDNKMIRKMDLESRFKGLDKKGVRMSVEQGKYLYRKLKPQEAK